MKILMLCICLGVFFLKAGEANVFAKQNSNTLELEVLIYRAPNNLKQKIIDESHYPVIDTTLCFLEREWQISLDIEYGSDGFFHCVDKENPVLFASFSSHYLPTFEESLIFSWSNLDTTSPFSYTKFDELQVSVELKSGNELWNGAILYHISQVKLSDKDAKISINRLESPEFSDEYPSYIILGDNIYFCFLIQKDDLSN